MDDQKYPVGSLVIFRDEIHEVVGIKITNDRPSYTIELRAFLRDITSSEWENQIKPG